MKDIVPSEEVVVKSPSKAAKSPRNETENNVTVPKETTPRPVLSHRLEEIFFIKSAFENVDGTSSNGTFRQAIPSIDSSHRKSMIVNGYKSEKELVIDTRVEKIRNQDDEIINSLQKCSNGHDKEVEKLTQELKEANNILANLEQNIEFMKAKKELNQKELENIKAEYKSLLEEKHGCEKQISMIRKDFDKIKDKRILRDFDQLSLCYEKLCQKERATRKQIALMEAELSMIVSKIDIPKAKARKSGTKKDGVPKLDLDKLNAKGLPPVKNPPKAPRRGNTIYPKDKKFNQYETSKAQYQVAGNAKLQKRYMKRNTAPHHSNGQPPHPHSGAPFLKGMIPRFTEEVHLECYLPLLGNQKELAVRPQKDAKGDFKEQKKDVRFPVIKNAKDRKPVELISAEKFSVQQKREANKKCHLPKVNNKKLNPY